MKTYLLLIIAFGSAYFLQAQHKSFEWIEQMGGSGDVSGNFIVRDSSRDILLGGNFSGLIDFDPDSTKTHNISDQGCFIEKLDSSGRYLWVKYFRATLTGMKIDRRGNIFMTGNFYGEPDFDFGIGVQTLKNADNDPDGYVLKLDRQGNFVWVKQLFAYTPVQVYSLDLDKNGDVIVAGKFQGTLFTDYGTPDIKSIQSFDSDDGFVIKMGNDGITSWLRVYGAIEKDEIFATCTDGRNNIYAAGTTLNTAFILKYNETGLLTWVKYFEGTNSYPVDIASNGENTIYLLGGFVDSIDADPSHFGVYKLSGINDIFLVALDTTAEFEWAEAIGGQYREYSGTIKLDSSGNIYISGSFEQVTDLDPTSSVYSLTSHGLRDAFVLRLNASGELLAVRALGNPIGYCGYSDFIVDRSGNMTATGYFYGKTDFDFDTGTYYLQSFGANDMFIYVSNIATFTGKETHVANSIYDQAVKLYPNPSTGMLNINSITGGISQIKIFDALGRQVYSAGNITSMSSLDVSQLKPGVYSVSIQTEDKRLWTYKLVRQ